MQRLQTWASVAVLAGVLTVLPSCASIGVEPATRSEALFTALKDNLIGNFTPAARTLQTLRKYDIEKLYEVDEAATQNRLLAVYKDEPSPDVLYALAELSFLAGRKAEHWGGDGLAAYYRAAGYAYHYLFAIARPTATGEWYTPQDAFDPRFRLACELYNQALGKCIRYAVAFDQIDPRGIVRIPTPTGDTFKISVHRVGFGWKAEDFNDLKLCSDFRVRGLANHHRTYGLGVPLIVTRYSEDAPSESFLARHQSFPATAFFRFEGDLDDLARGRRGRLELYDPLRVQAIDVRGRRVPLEADLTTPLAYGLANTELTGGPVEAFLRPQKLVDDTGLYMLEPYCPGKIPVVFVHGLLSSPMTWAPMFNDLLAEPEIRSRYQFWFYFYPTSLPYLASAADLRRRLATVRQRFDPDGSDPGLKQMVFVGHSMGGLVSKLLTVDSGDAFYRLTGQEPLETLPVSEKSKELLREVLYFQHDPGIAHAVFIGTPHGGSRLSTSTLGKLGSRLAGMPRTLVQTGREIFRAGLADDWQRVGWGLPTSVEMLSPNAPALRVLQELPRPPGTTYHSIIGVAGPCDMLIERILGSQLGVVGDGVVPYHSAHIANAASEIVVAGTHFTEHQHPLAVLEVRRILREHLAALDGGAARSP